MSVKLVVLRNSERDIKMREMEIFVDDQYRKSIHYGARFEMDLEPGEHRVTVSNRMMKRTLEFVARDGETVTYLGTNVLMGGPALILGALGMIPYKVEIERVA